MYVKDADVRLKARHSLKMNNVPMANGNNQLNLFYYER